MESSQPREFKAPLDGLVLCLVEDDFSAIKVYSRWLGEAGARVVVFSSVGSFQTALASGRGICSEDGAPARACLTDLVLPDGSGLDVVSMWKKQNPSLPVLVSTAFATVENAVHAMKMGAFDFLRKPVPMEEFILVLRRALDFVQLLEENESLASSVRVLGMAQVLAQISDGVSVLKTLGRLLHRETKAEESFVYFFDGKRGRPDSLLECRAPGATRITPELIASRVLEPLLAGRTTNSGDDANTKRDLASPFVHPIEKERALVVELASQTGNSGFIVLLQRSGPFSIPAKIETLQPLLVQASRSFQAADVTNTLSFVDGLTGLYNQHFLSVTLRSELSRTNRYGAPVSVLFMDLDHFKEINDSHGHIVGSQVLKEAANVFRLCVRESDYLLRFGGDEFVAILPNTNLLGASLVAERIRYSFETTKFDVRMATGVPSAFDLQVTTSIGVAAYPHCASTYEELVQRADDAMYRAKRQGKNRACLVEEMAETPFS